MSRCPVCSHGERQLILSTLLVNRWRCLACNHEWEEGG